MVLARSRDVHDSLGGVSGSTTIKVSDATSPCPDEHSLLQICYTQLPFGLHWKKPSGRFLQSWSDLHPEQR
jgi:hypothetical protein